MSRTQLNIKGVSAGYGNEAIIHEIQFSLNDGDIGCLLGPSGCGKTTLLRVIAGFEPLMQGEIWLRNQQVANSDMSLAPEQRHVGMVFQDFALFPHLSVMGNITFGIHQLPKQQQEDRACQLLDLVGMRSFSNVFPHELSGGQQQRIALIRALAPKPDILLLDEPFSSMDVEIRQQLAKELRTILRQEGVTALMVTHDQHEAFAMADLIGVMHEGKLVQCDSGYNLYHIPANRFVADFIGEGVFFQGTIVDESTVDSGLGLISGPLPEGCKPGHIVDVLIRPDDIIHDDDSGFKGVVIDKDFRGADFMYGIRLENGMQVLCLAPSHHNHDIGESIGIRVDVDHLVVFKRD